MPWEPDPQLRQLLYLQLNEIREPRLVLLQRDTWPRLENQLAALGLAGGGMIQVPRDAAAGFIEEVGDDFIATVRMVKCDEVFQPSSSGK